MHIDSTSPRRLILRQDSFELPRNSAAIPRYTNEFGNKIFSPRARSARRNRLLEPGESADWNLAPNMFSDWGKVEELDDMVFTVTTTRLDGADGEALFVDNFGERRGSRRCGRSSSLRMVAEKSVLYRAVIMFNCRPNCSMGLRV